MQETGGENGKFSNKVLYSALDLGSSVSFSADAT